MSDQHPIDIWQRGYEIGVSLARAGVDERALHGGEIKKWKGWKHYYPMNRNEALILCPAELRDDQHDEFMDGVIEGFERGD